ncbi:MAG: hypothetical protein VX737_00830 [Pseudomonadota bacterium]|nr:hypothetical protein [Pseudomonadota bacterium]
MSKLKKQMDPSLRLITMKRLERAIENEMKDFSTVGDMLWVHKPSLVYR